MVGEAIQLVIADRPERGTNTRVSGKWAVPALLALTIAASLGTAPSASAAPPTLSKRQAAKDVRLAVRDKFDTGARAVSCRKTSRLTARCTARWTYILRRYTGRVSLTRSGTATSPIDRYRLFATGRRRYLSTRRVRTRGRVIFDTRRARLGQTLRLLGQRSSRTDVEVTASPYIDPFPTGEFEPAPAGTRWVGVPLRIVNRARARWSDSLSNGARLVLADTTELSARITTRCVDSVSAAPGEARSDCVAFQVPVGVGIRQFEYQPDSGYGRETGVWR